ncbi:MAG: hypothetical protein EXR12_06545 [Rhodospirillaceae bacterium]|nr:hypothetical protein [Rhodospirillaceae bacterium]
MGSILIPGLPDAEPAAEPWPVDEHTIRIDEMFARQLDNEFSACVRGLLHDPETGISAQSGEAALQAIAGAMPVLNELKDRTLAQAIGPRQRSILEPLIETRLDWAAGTLGRLAQRATVEVDDQSIADRIAGLNQDAATAWHDPAYLRRLGRTAVEELRYQGERRGWDPAETDTRVRGGLSDIYAGAVETAIGQDDLDGAAGLYDRARPVIDPERQTAIDRCFAQAREAAVYRDVDRDMAGIPIEPAGPPGLDIFEQRAAELTPEGVSDNMRARIADVAAFAQRRAERQWNKQQAGAGIAAFDWIGKNPDASLVTLPSEIRDWLVPDQWRGIETLAVEGRLKTDGDLFERLDRLLVYEPDSFAAVDLDRHRLSLDDEDQARFAAAQKAIAEGWIDPDLARYDRMRRGIDRAVKALGIDAEGPEAADARADARDRLDGFETSEGRAPNGEDIDGIVGDIVSGIALGGAAVEGPLPGAGDGFDPRHVVPAQAGGRPPPFRPQASPPLRPRPQPQPQPGPGPGHNQPPGQIPGIAPGRPSPSVPQPPQGTQPGPDTAGPAAAAEQAAAQERAATYNAYREHLQKLDPDNALLKLEPVTGVPPDKVIVESIQKEVTRAIREKVDTKTEELRAKSTYEQRSKVKTIGGDVDLRKEFDELKATGTRVYAGRGQYGKGGDGEMFELPGGQGIRVGFRMANDTRTGAKNSIPTLDIVVPGRGETRFHYNPMR